MNRSKLKSCMNSLMFKVFILHGECRFRYLLFIKESKHVNLHFRLLSGQDCFLFPRIPLKTAHLDLTNLSILSEKLSARNILVSLLVNILLCLHLHQWALELGWWEIIAWFLLLGLHCIFSVNWMPQWIN